LVAKDHAAEQQLLDSAHKPADLFQRNGDPFDLEIDFIAQFKGSVPGHLSIKWQTKDHWWSKVEFGGFEQILITNGEMVYTSRNFNYTPTEVLNLFSLLSFGGKSPLRLIAQKERDRTQDGISLACVQAEQEIYVRDSHEFCLDLASRDLVSNEWQDQPVANKVVKKRQQFAGYVDFDGKRYPKKLELLENGVVVVSAIVTNLQAAPFDPALLLPPKGAIERRMCPDIKPPRGIKESSPSFAGAGIPAGIIEMSLTILTDGSVGDIRITHSSGQKADQIAIAAARKVKYAPAMCGSEPVVSDLEVRYTFKMN
jgi:TonB family protein